MRSTPDRANSSPYTATMFSRLSSMKEMAIAIAENSVQGIVVMNEDGHCLFANRAWADITGFSNADMASKPVREFLSTASGR